MIIPRQILILTLLAVALNLVYLVWSDSIFSLYIIWNIILAAIPFFISYYLLQYYRAGKRSILMYVLGGCFWLLFFPNAPYLVTDIMHLGESIGVPLWFDSLTLFCSAWIGLMLGIYSLSFIEKILQEKFSKHFTTFLIMLAILLSSFGIYIGRFLRLNSWDALIFPKYVFHEIWIAFSSPAHFVDAYAFIVIFFAFIYISFYAWKFTQGKE